MDNIKFTYLYRDAGNFKKWAEVVFSNPEGLAPDAITKALRHAFLEGDLFLADQVRLPELFLYAKGNATSDDHCFHEFDAVQISLEFPNDRYKKSISQFIAETEKEARHGWVAFDPHGELGEQMLK
jgi:hypothetical protein